MNKKPRVRAALALAGLLGTAAVATLATATPASAAPTSVGAACKYPFYDDYWRGNASTIDGSATGSTTAGSNISLSGTVLTGEIGAGLIEYAYGDLGLFASQAANSTETHTITGLRAWVAITGSNTSQGTQVLEVTDGTASTTITDVNGVATATPLVYSFNLPDSTWTASGGDVEFRLASGDALPSLPNAGIRNGTSFDPTGSVYVRGALETLQVNLDCQPGSVNDSTGSSITPATAAAFASVTGGGGTGPGPQPQPSGFECISNLGAFASNGIDVGEIMQVPMELKTTQAPQTGAGTVTLRTLQLEGTVPANAVAAAYARNQLPLGTSTQTGIAYIAIEGTNTQEGIQTIPAEFSFETNVVSDPTPAEKNNGDQVAEPAAFTISFPNTTWTPNGTGNIDFKLAPAGSLPRVTNISSGYAGFYPVWPYGSLYVRSTMGHYGSNLDCVNGSIELADTSVSRQLYGNIPAERVQDPIRPDEPNQTVMGSQGRYTITEAAAPIVATVEVTSASGSVLNRQIVTLSVVGSPLRMQQAGTLVNLSSVAPGGTSAGSLRDVTVIDERGTNAGWNLTGQLSDLTSTGDLGAGTSIPASGASWTPNAAVVSGSGAVTPGPAATDLSVGKQLCAGEVGNSGGTFSCGAALQVPVPSSAAIGGYNGTVTVTLV